MNNLNLSAKLEAHLCSVKVLIVAFYNFKPSIRQVVNSITENIVFKRDPIVRALAKENVQWNCRVKTLSHTLFLRQKILQRVLFATSCSSRLIRYILLLRITICSNTHFEPVDQIQKRLDGWILSRNTEFFHCPRQNSSLVW